MTRTGDRAEVPAFPLPWSHYVRLLVLAAEYRTALPKERTLVAEIERTIQQFEARRATPRARTRRPRE